LLRVSECRYWCDENKKRKVFSSREHLPFSLNTAVINFT
jgi:hypothetical protein